MLRDYNEMKKEIGNKKFWNMENPIIQWNILYKDDSNILHQLQEKYCEWNSSVRKTKPNKLMLES